MFSGIPPLHAQSRRALRNHFYGQGSFMRLVAVQRQSLPSCRTWLASPKKNRVAHNGPPGEGAITGEFGLAAPNGG